MHGRHCSYSVPWLLYKSMPVAAPASTLFVGLSLHRTSRLASWTTADEKREW
jgi:hypothetical protein